MKEETETKCHFAVSPSPNSVKTYVQSHYNSALRQQIKCIGSSSRTFQSIY